MKSSGTFIFIIVIAFIPKHLLAAPKFDDEYGEAINEIRKLNTRKPDPNVGKLVAAWKPNSGVNVDEIGPYPDIIHPPSLSRNGIIDTYYRWPGGVIPYIITGTFTSAELARIQSAMQAYHTNTCIKFRPYNSTTDTDYINIQNANSGCWSYLGRIRGMQALNLQTPGCVYYAGTAIHELMHAIGFYHEQSSTNRDNYVTIMWQNIQPGYEHNFDKYSATQISPFGVSYDYGSILHYSATAFSRNGYATIVPKVSTATIGQRNGLSSSDIQKIRAMYKCVGSVSTL